MKILFINAVYGVGSTGIIIRDLGAKLKKDGHTPFYAFQNCSEQPNGEYFIIGNKMDWKIHALLTRFTGKQGFYSKNATIKLIKWIKKIRPDVIQIHNLHSNYIHLPTLTEGIKNIKTILVLDDCWHFTGKCTHFAHSNCFKWEVCCKTCPQKNESVKNYFFDSSEWVYQNKNKCYKNIKKLAIVGVSSWISEQAQKSMLANNSHYYIYNGIDTNIFNPFSTIVSKDRFGFYESDIVLMSFSSKWAEKENKLLIDKIKQMLDKDKFKLVLIGKPVLKHRNVKNLSYIKSQKAMAEIMTNSDIFLNLSREDTMSRVTAESMLCGTPVIGLNYTAIPEIINKVNFGGIIIRNENELEDAINKIIVKNYKKRLINNFNEIKKDFDIENTYLKYKSIYESE